MTNPDIRLRRPSHDDDRLLVGSVIDFAAIERAVNDAAKRVNAIWLSLILLMTYVFISTGKITHIDLFFETPAKLPVLGVDVPLRGYFLCVSAFVLALHFYFAVQLSGLATKFHEYERVLRQVADSAEDRQRLHQRLDNSLFAKVLSAPVGGYNAILRVVGWTSMVLGPLCLLLFVQLTYLPQQDVAVTNWHKTVLVIDCLLAIFYLLPSMFGHESWLKGRRTLGTRVGQFGRLVVKSPDIIVITISIIALLWISFLVAVFPWQYSPFSTLNQSWFMSQPDPLRQGPSNWFSNRLVLPDKNLIEGYDISKGSVTRVLRDRSFVAAIFDRSDLRQADFTGTNLRNASFVGTKLKKAIFSCARFDNNDFKGCTQLQQADFSFADMDNADLSGANMFGAWLFYAQLNNANLQYAQLQGAVLDYSKLETASMHAVELDGASLRFAALIGASLYGAKVRGVDFSHSLLVGASLEFSLAQNASFAGAQLQGTTIKGSNFDGTKLVGVAVFGADVSASSFTGARIGNVLASSRWNIDYYLGTLSLYQRSDGDPFGKDGDINEGTWADVVPDRPDPENPKYFEKFVSIPKSQSDREASLLVGKSESGSHSEKFRRLAPNMPTADWGKLVTKSVSDAEYLSGLGERLIIIACADIGGTDVVQGLAHQGRICSFKKEVERVAATGIRPDGKVCENRFLRQTISKCPRE